MNKVTVKERVESFRKIVAVNTSPCSYIISFRSSFSRITFILEKKHGLEDVKFLKNGLRLCKK